MRSRAVDTHWLTHASLEPVPRRSGWLQWPGIGLLALCLLLSVAAALMLGNSVDAAAAQARQYAEVERLRTELAVAHATREELERQAAGLNDRVAELSRQVQFLSARGADGAHLGGRQP
jgi:cell division protein FtsB